MARRLRLHHPGAIYHVISRGNRRRRIFLDSDDFQAFIRGLKFVKQSSQFLLYAYCLMPNHIHLLIRVQQTSLSKIMQRILGRYAQFHNARRGETGHVFQGRFKSLGCQKVAYCMRLVEYINKNPVRAGLAHSARDWPWSGVGNPYAGAEGLVDVLRDHGDFKFPAPMTVVQRDTRLGEIAKNVVSETGLSLESIRGTSKIRRFVRSRRLIVERALQQGFSIAEIARYLERSEPTIWKMTLGGKA